LVLDGKGIGMGKVSTVKGEAVGEKVGSSPLEKIEMDQRL
jgi:hypothetical protein